MTIEKFVYPEGVAFNSSQDIIFRLSKESALSKGANIMEAGDHKISPKRLKRRRFSRTLRVGEKVGSWATLSPNIASPKVAEKYEIVIGDKRPTGEVKLKKEGHGYFVIEERDDQRFLLEAYVFTNRPLPQRKR